MTRALCVPLPYSATPYTGRETPRQARLAIRSVLARRRRILGQDHPDTLQSANGLANALSALGEDQAARELHEDVLARPPSRVLGEDHPDTLGSGTVTWASSMYALGEYQAARELDEDVLARRSRVLGEDHPDTLGSVSNLAGQPPCIVRVPSGTEIVRGCPSAALSPPRGEDHPNTLWSSNGLASSLYMLGEYQEARGIFEDALARRRRAPNRR